jgi:hypothetical protein
MAPDIECMQYHQWMVRNWTQHEVIWVVPVPGMAVYCQWMVQDWTSLDMLVWEDWSENGSGRMDSALECVQYHWTLHEVIRVAPVPGMAVCCHWRVRDRMSLELLVWGLGMRIELEEWLLILKVYIIVNGWFDIGRSTR